MLTRLADWILDHPFSILGGVLLVTLLLGYWATRVETDHTAGTFLSEESETLQDLDRAGRTFGRSATLLYVVFEDADPLDADFLRHLDRFTERTRARDGVEYVLSLTNTPYLTRQGDGLATQPLYAPDLEAQTQRDRLVSQPFLRGFLLSADTSATTAVVKIDRLFNDTPARADLVAAIRADAEALPGNAALAGFPYLRTEYAHRVTTEAPLFTLGALLVSLVLLFVMFRSWRAVALPTIVTILSIIWTVGLIALFGEKLNIVTGLLPALVVVIGMATAIHLTTAFYDAYEGAVSIRNALRQTVRTVGVTTFLACLTTAIGFTSLVFSGSELLSVFGRFAAAGILFLYGLSVTLIPLAYYHGRPPTTRTARLATHGTLARTFDRLAVITQHHTSLIMGGAVLLVVIGSLGAAQLSDDIYVFSDFFEDDPLREDLAVYQDHFGGVLPMEVIVEAERSGGFRSIGRLRQLQQLQDSVATLPYIGQALSAADFVKVTNQAYFGGRPQAYRFPSSYELPFLQRVLTPYLRGDGGDSLFSSLPTMVDTSFTTVRLYLGVDDIGTSRMTALSDTVEALARGYFPSDGYDVTVTGTAVANSRSGANLVFNLLVSLGVALVLISLLMVALFRSARLTVISLLPNLIPLLLVGGAMGYFGISVKPSTALIFPLAFGIAVDDTIHFLAKYRLLRRQGLGRDDAVRQTLRVTGKALLFTSLVLAAGFLVFTFSSFGGTVVMGALMALTLLLAVTANLLLLPALLFRFAPR